MITPNIKKIKLLDTADYDWCISAMLVQVMSIGQRLILIGMYNCYEVQNDYNRIS